MHDIHLAPEKLQKFNYNGLERKFAPFGETYEDRLQIN